MQPPGCSIKVPADGTATDEQAQVGQQWVDKFGRVRTPCAYYERDDGTVLKGRAALDAFDAHFAAPARRSRTPELSVVTLAAPRERREQRTSRSSGQDPGDDDPEPPPSRRLAGRQDIEDWIAEREQTLGALTRGAQLGFDEREAA